MREIIDKKIWEDFLLDCKEKTFLQSWNWGEFNKEMGSKIWRLGLYGESSEFKAQSSKPQFPPRTRFVGKDKTQNPELIAVALVIRIKARRGTFLLVPHGPIINNRVSSIKYQVLEILLEKLIEIAKEENCSFIRISPIWERTKENEKIFRELGFRNAPIHIHPELTWKLDITIPEQELLMNMRKTTRYLIRQGLKNQDIEIIQDNSVRGVEEFNKLYQKTVDRQHFIPFSLDYLKNEFLVFSQDNQISVFLGKYKGEILASAMIIFYQDRAFYHQGASWQKYPKIPVSYLLQWEAIKEAKKRGCQIYNFWGIAPVCVNKARIEIINKNHPWYGLSLFKIGFGGYKKEYVKTQDFVISKRYWINYIIEKMRRIKRGL